MKKIHVLIGPAGVGKSTVIRERAAENDIVLSFDQLRLEMYDSLREGNKHNAEVFDELHNRLNHAIVANESDIYYDATNTNRKMRRKLYNRIKDMDKDNNYEVVATVIHKPLSDVLKQNAQRDGYARVPDDRVIEMYKNLQPPKLGLDCDSLEVIAPDFSAYQSEMNSRIDEPHNSPYHMETLREHIDMTVTGANEFVGNSDTKEALIDIAEHHDLGKAVCRQKSDKDTLASRFVVSQFGEYNNYNNHQNVGAMYYLVKNKDNLTPEVLDRTEVIFQHMQAHNGFTPKYIRRNQLSDKVLDLAQKFAEIDSASRVLDDELFDHYSKLRYLDPESKLQKYFERNGNDVMVSTNFDKDLYTIKYLHGGVDFTDPALRNARGLTLNLNDEIVTIGFEKFFNYKQLESYGSYSEDGLEFSQKYSDDFIDKYSDIHGDILDVYEKLDGTLICLGIDGDNLVASTSSSTRTAWSQKAEDYFNNLPNSDQLKSYLKDENMSLMFEYTAPDNLIVIPYNETKYTLIGARERDLSAPIKPYSELVEIANQLDLDVVSTTKMTIPELLDYQSQNQDSEGFVVQNQHGNLVKFKTDYWFEQKATQGDFFFGESLTKSKIERYTELFINDEFDDLIAFKNQHYGHEQFSDLDKMNQRLSDFVLETKKVTKEYSKLGRESIANAGLDSRIRQAVFKEKDGQDWSSDFKYMKGVANDIANDLKIQRLTQVSDDLVNEIAKDVKPTVSDELIDQLANDIQLSDDLQL